LMWEILFECILCFTGVNASKKASIQLPQQQEYNSRSIPSKNEAQYFFHLTKKISSGYPYF
jgi:hypothetical protein